MLNGFRKGNGTKNAKWCSSPLFCDDSESNPLSPHYAKASRKRKRTMKDMTLYRAAERENGYFGQGSYWTPSRMFAARFAQWAAKEQSVVIRQGMALWKIDISEPEERVLDLRPPRDLLLFSSMAINRRIIQFAERGFLWVFFYEGVFEGTISTQAVYVGTEELQPVPIGTLAEPNGE